MIVAPPPLPVPVRAAIVVPMSRRVSPPWPGCVTVLRPPHGTLLTCGAKLEGTLRLRLTGGRVVRFRLSGVSPLQWSRAARSPDGRWFLLKADIACDTSGTFVVPTAGGAPKPVPRPPPGCDANVGVPLGWTRDNRAIVVWRPSPTCRCTLPEGVYSVDPRTRHGRLIWRGRVQPLLQREAMTP
jgi:hypothetical protein